MPGYSILGFAALVLGAAAPSLAVPLTADFGYTVDEHGGYGLDADFSLSPGEHWTLSASAGHSEGTPESGNVSGTLLGVAASFHGERAGISLSYDLFDDSTNYQAGTLAARAWLAAGDFEFALLGRRRDLSAGLTLRLPLRDSIREVKFAANGVGLSVSYGTGNFNAYVMGLEYDYDQEFDDFVGLLDSPQLEDRPRLEALVTSFISQAQGTIDRQAGAGIEYGFGRHSLALDVSFVHDAVLDADSSSLAVTWRHARSAHLDWGLTAGLVDSEQFGDIAFAGVGVGVAN
jgi:hypothetical protein